MWRAHEQKNIKSLRRAHEQAKKKKPPSLRRAHEKPKKFF
jgi:hypothetical protein